MNKVFKKAIIVLLNVSLSVILLVGGYGRVQARAYQIPSLAPLFFPPPLPTTFSATDGTYFDKVQVTWTNSLNATYYQVYMNTSNTSSGAILLRSPATSPYDDTTVVAGITYYYFLKACNSTGCSGFSAPESGYAGLHAPESLYGTNGTYADKVQVGWYVPSSGATHYDVYRNTANSSTGAALVGSTAASPFDDTTAAIGLLYYYFVKGCNQNCSAFSSSVVGYRALPPPTGVSASDGDYLDKVQITWTAESWATSYEVYRRVTNGGTTSLGTTTGTTYNDTSVVAGTLYYYTVRACKSLMGCSHDSAEDSGYRAMTAPSSVSATDGTYPDKVQISWGVVSDAVSYEVYRNSSNSYGGAALLGQIAASPFDDTTAVPGTLYYYWVKACGSARCSAYSASDLGHRFVPAPAIPTGVFATDSIYTDEVQVRWNASSGATSYQVWRNTTNASGSAIQIGTPPVSPYYDTPPIAGTIYWYFVKGCNIDGCSEFSASDWGYRALAAPTGVTATNGDFTDKVRITWNASSGASSYEVWRNTANDSGSATKIGTPANSPYDDTTAVPGTDYYYFVKACNGGGCSDYSASNSGYRRLSTPTGVSASDGFFTDKVQVTWGTVSGALYYHVNRNTINDFASSTAAVPNAPPYNHTTAVPGTLYYYWVAACGATGCSDYSPPETGYRALTPPTGVSATDGTYTDKVQVSWTVVSGATYYQIWRAGYNSSAEASLLSSPAVSPYDDTTVLVYFPYYYFIKACSVAGCSAFSTSDYGYTGLLPPPTGVSATDGSFTDKVQVTWTASTGATSYQVWRNTTNTSAGATLVGTPAASHYDDTTAVPGTTYYYFVEPCNAPGCSGISTSDPGFRAITPPTGVSATDGSFTDKVQVNWTAASGATSYQVWRNTTNTSAGAAQIGTPAASPYDDTTAVSGTTYYYFVKACNGGVCSAFSTSDSGFRAIAPPPVPTGASATDGSFTDKVQVSWSASTGATSYQVWRNTTNASASAAQIGTPANYPYDDTTAAAGTIYYYFVKACNGGVCSGFSTSDSGFRAITPPTGASATDGSFTDKVQVSWSASTGATSYQVWRNTTNASASAAQIGTPAASPYDDTTAVPGTTYYYFVKACNGGVCSGFSTSDSGFRAITPPTGVSATDGSFTDKVQVTWTASTGATSYQVWRNTTNASASAAQIGTPAASPYNDTTAVPGTTYYYFVKACNGGGCSGFSASDSGFRAIAPPPVPTGVSASDGNFTDKVRITWNASSGAASYQVWRSATNDSGGAAQIGTPAASPYDDTSAVAGTTYWYFVKACTAGGCSGFSLSDSGFRAIAPPAVPTGVSATDGSFTDKVQVSWAAESGATSYQVWRNTTNASGSAAQLGTPANSPYEDTTAVAGTTYWYFIKACNSAGCSDFSLSDSGYRAETVTPPSAPTGVSATDGTYPDKVQITWTAASSAAYYDVYRNTSNTSVGATQLGSPFASPYADTSAVAGTTYWYFVKACNGAGCSVFSLSDSGYRAVLFKIYLALVIR